MVKLRSAVLFLIVLLAAPAAFAGSPFNLFHRNSTPAASAATVPPANAAAAGDVLAPETSASAQSLLDVLKSDVNAIALNDANTAIATANASGGDPLVTQCAQAVIANPIVLPASGTLTSALDDLKRALAAPVTGAISLAAKDRAIARANRTLASSAIDTAAALRTQFAQGSPWMNALAAGCGGLIVDQANLLNRFVPAAVLKLAAPKS
jgi:hypothetical protein